MAGALVERAALPVHTSSLNTKLDVSARPRSSNLEAVFSPVNNDGCFDFDRVLKSGYVQKRTQKTKVSFVLPAFTNLFETMARWLPNCPYNTDSFDVEVEDCLPGTAA